jgi:hypothetical protein
MVREFAGFLSAAEPMGSSCLFRIWGDQHRIALETHWAHSVMHPSQVSISESSLTLTATALTNLGSPGINVSSEPVAKGPCSFPSAQSHGGKDCRSLWGKFRAN